jgi:hypothetical protein
MLDGDVKLRAHNPVGIIKYVGIIILSRMKAVRVDSG